MSNTPPPDVPTITVQELRDIRQSGDKHFLLDVREPNEFATARIEGSKLIPLSELASRLGEVPADERIIVHCKLGGRSAKAVSLLQQHGFSNVWNVAGGIAAWSNEVDPGVPTY